MYQVCSVLCQGTKIWKFRLKNEFDGKKLEKNQVREDFIPKGRKGPKKN